MHAPRKTRVGKMTPRTSRLRVLGNGCSNAVMAVDVFALQRARYGEGCGRAFVLDQSIN